MSVMNNPLALCMRRRGYCVGLCKVHPLWHIYAYRICVVYIYTYDHVYIMFLYKGIIICLAIECQLNTGCTAVVGVEYYHFNSGH